MVVAPKVSLSMLSPMAALTNNFLLKMLPVFHYYGFVTHDE
jgi:hypothetical protein